MTSLLDALVHFLSAPLRWEWQTGDVIAAAALLISLVAGLLAIIARRRERVEARIANAPDVVVTFRRVHELRRNTEDAHLAEIVVPALENIGRSPAYEIECVFTPWPTDTPWTAQFSAAPVHIQHMSAGSAIVLANHRSIHVDWNIEGRAWDDLPYAIFEYVVSYSDRTHRYVNAFLVSLFGFPDQLTQYADNDATVPTIHQHSVPLRRAEAAARWRDRWEYFARPVRRWRYRRILNNLRVAATSSLNFHGPAFD